MISLKCVNIIHIRKGFTNFQAEHCIFIFLSSLPYCYKDLIDLHYKLSEFVVI